MAPLGIGSKIFIRVLDILLFLGIFCLLGIGGLSVLLFGDNHFPLVTFIAYSGITCLGLSFLPGLYYFDHRFGKLFNAYLYEHPSCLPNFSGLPNKIYIRLKVNRGVYYAGLVLALVVNRKGLSPTQTYIAKSKAFRQKLNFLDYFMAFYLLGGFVLFLAAICVPTMLEWLS